MRRGTAAPYLLLAPALLAAAVLVLLPVAETVWLSLHDAVLFRPRTRPFIGLDNYVRALADPQFWQSLWHSLIWVAAAVGLQFLLGLGAALLLNRRFAWRGIARALVVVPWALPSVIIGLVWTWMLDFNLGVVNLLGTGLGLLAAPVPFLAQSGDGASRRHPGARLAGLSVFRRHDFGGIAGHTGRALRGGCARRRREAGAGSGTSPGRGSRR